MTAILALDIGKRRTGVALGDSVRPFILALKTIHHSNENELVKSVENIVKEKNISRIVLGLPLLPDGSIGEQAEHVRMVAKLLENSLRITPEFIDERYTSLRAERRENIDVDASAACAILDVALSQITGI